MTSPFTIEKQPLGKNVSRWTILKSGDDKFSTSKGAFQFTIC